MNPLLQALLDRATTPLVPQSAIQPAQDSLDQRSLSQSPTMARIKGFGAGALQGARDLTSPLNIGLMAGDDLPIAMGLKALGGLGKAAAPVGRAIESTLPTLKPTLTGLGKLAVPAVTRGAKAAETLGEMSPEFTAVGGEGMFNAERAGNMVGRMPVPKALGAMPPPPANGPMTMPSPDVLMKILMGRE